MKKFICILLCLLLIAAAGCAANQPSESTEPTTEPVPESTAATEPEDGPLITGKSLKILAITSSFGLNTTEQIYHIAKAEGFEDVTVGRLYISGCSLSMHVNNAMEDAGAYRYYKTNTGPWTITENVSMKQGLLEEDWDIIFLQQGAALAGKMETYGINGNAAFVDYVVAYINKHKTNPDAKLVWNMTWAYQSDSTQAVFIDRFKSDQMYMYNEIVNVTTTLIEPMTCFSAIIPTGTAVQNARTSYFGDNLTKDTYHLNNLGRVIAGYTLYSILMDQPLTEINLNEASSYDLKTPVVLTDSDKKVIIEAVNAAIKSPYRVTESSYKTSE